MEAGDFQSTKIYNKTVTIQVGQTESEAINISGTTIVGVITDANITGTSIKFKASTDNTTFLDYKGNDSTPAVVDVELLVTGSAAEWYGLNATDFSGVQYIKLVSGTAQAGTDSVITLVLKGGSA